MKKRERKKNNTKKILLILFLLISIGGILFILLNFSGSINEIDYSKYYNDIVRVNKDSKIYLFNENEYVESGIVYKDTLLKLDNIEDPKNKYFKISSMDDEYYIEYSNVDKSDNFYLNSDRYLRRIEN